MLGGTAGEARRGGDGIRGLGGCRRWLHSHFFGLFDGWRGRSRLLQRTRQDRIVKPEQLIHAGADLAIPYQASPMRIGCRRRRHLVPGRQICVALAPASNQFLHEPLMAGVFQDAHSPSRRRRLESGDTRPLGKFFHARPVFFWRTRFRPVGSLEDGFPLFHSSAPGRLLGRSSPFAQIH